MDIPDIILNDDDEILIQDLLNTFGESNNIQTAESIDMIIDEPFEEHQYDIEDPSCCVCFSEGIITNIKSLGELSEEDITHDTIIKSVCNRHCICIGCLYKIVTDYTNHPINEHNSHVYCPYPFGDCLTVAQTKNTFEHDAILKIIPDEFEKQQFIEHASRYQFPGYTIINCPCTFYRRDEMLVTLLCNYPVLIENEFIKSADIGDLIIQCHQNEHCCKNFCFHCRKEVSLYERECRTCKLLSENENPNILNRYIIKDSHIQDSLTYDEEQMNTKYFDETDYLFYNKEITKEYAIEYITKLIEHNVHCICPICKIHLHKTERCNGMRHHNVERCYACGRIGTRTGGIHNNHWNSDGIGGCFRFDYDRFVSNYIPEYRCTTTCQNHDVGDCKLPNHIDGINKMSKIRQKAIIYHCIKSLLPDLRYEILHTLYDKYTSVPTAYELLPYKQTYLFVESFTDVFLDYSEETIYDHIKVINPKNLSEFIDKTYVINPSDYLLRFPLIETYHIPSYFIPHTENETLAPPPRPLPPLPFLGRYAENMLEQLMNEETRSLLHPTDFIDDIPEIDLGAIPRPTLFHDQNIQTENNSYNNEQDNNEQDNNEQDNNEEDNDTLTEPDVEININNIRIFYNLNSQVHEERLRREVYVLGTDTDTDTSIENESDISDTEQDITDN